MESDLSALLPVLMESDAGIEEECTMTKEENKKYGGGWEIGVEKLPRCDPKSPDCKDPGCEGESGISCAEKCKNLCLERDACKYYTYYAKDYNGWSHEKSRCMMYKSKRSTRRNNYTTSGAKISCPDADV